LVSNYRFFLLFIGVTDFYLGFSDQGIFQTPMQFAKTIPNVKNDTNASPTVLIFGAQATRGILKEDHPYVSQHSLCAMNIFL
jgi:hypothetical protein